MAEKAALEDMLQQIRILRYALCDELSGIGTKLAHMPVHHFASDGDGDGDGDGDLSSANIQNLEVGTFAKLLNILMRCPAPVTQADSNLPIPKKRKLPSIIKKVHIKKEHKEKEKKEKKEQHKAASEQHREKEREGETREMLPQEIRSGNVSQITKGNQNSPVPPRTRSVSHEIQQGNSSLSRLIILNIGTVIVLTPPEPFEATSDAQPQKQKQQNSPGMPPFSPWSPSLWCLSETLLLFVSSDRRCPTCWTATTS